MEHKTLEPSASGTFVFPPLCCLKGESGHLHNKKARQSFERLFSIMPLTILKMLANKVMNDSGFSDLGRLLQQTASDNTTAGSEREEHNVAGVYLFGFIMLVIAIFACIRRRENVVDVPELPGDKTVHKTPKSTFAQRKRDMLDLFETSEVTMVSHDCTGI
jgi:hypothetical protein